MKRNCCAPQFLLSWRVNVFLIVCALTLPVAAEVLAQDRGPARVIVAEVTREEFADRVEALGTLRANESIEVSTTVSDRVVELGFDDGDFVAAGDMLARLESAEERAAVKAAEALLAEQRAAYERTKQLANRNFASKANLDEGLANLLEAEAALETARARLDDRTIRAPFAGQIGLRDLSVGALVEPGDVITTLDDISKVKLDFDVPSAYLAALVPGLRISAKTTAFSGEIFEGTIRSVSNQVNPVTRSVTARAIIPNTDGRLRPGLLMTVTLYKNVRQATLVREEALMPSGRQNFVMLVDTQNGNIAVKREVTLGVRREGWVEILQGVEEGDLVITHGNMKARPGQPVEIITMEEGEQTIGEMLEQGKGS